MPAKKDTKPAPPKGGKGTTTKAPSKAPAKKGAAKRAPPQKGVAKKAPLKKGAKGAAQKGKDAKGKPKKGVSRPSKYKHLFYRPPINRGIGQAIQRRHRDLTRYVKWPRYIRIQRQRKVLLNRLKVPPSINQFSRVLDANATTSLFKLLGKYRPEDRVAKRKRLTKVAEARSKGNVANIPKKPLAVKQGANRVIKLIERKKAKLVIIAGDVNPIELVVAIPALCRKVDIPYVIIKSKARLGALVHRKTCAALAFHDVRKEDKTELANLAAIGRESFNENIEHRRQWGGGKLSAKSAAQLAKKQKAAAKDARPAEMK